MSSSRNSGHCEPWSETLAPLGGSELNDDKGPGIVAKEDNVAKSSNITF
jgi:hypothetical protein